MRRDLTHTLEPPLRRQVERLGETCQRARGYPSGVEALGPRARHELAAWHEGFLREVTGTRDTQRFGIANEQRPGRGGTAEPLLPRHGVEVDFSNGNRDRSD